MISNIGTLDGPYPISELGTGDMPFSGIGAACRIDGNQSDDGWVMMVDLTGSLYTYLQGDGAWSTQVQPISNIAVGNNPFGLNGIGALAFNHLDADGSSSRWVFNKDGDQFALYSNFSNSFGTTFTVDNFGGGGIPFALPKCSAAIGFNIGNYQYVLLFNNTGTKYAISGEDAFGEHVIIGPFDL